MLPRKGKPAKDLVFCCPNCGGGVEGTSEMKCDRCGSDVVVRRRITYASGKIKYDPLTKVTR